MHKVGIRHSLCSHLSPLHLTESRVNLTLAPQSFSVSLDQVGSSVLVHASINPSLPSHTCLSEKQHIHNFASMTALHIARDPCGTAGNQTPPKGPTSATTLKKSSSKTGTLSAHCTTLGLPARDPSSRRSGTRLWAKEELLLKVCSQLPFPIPHKAFERWQS